MDATTGRQLGDIAIVAKKCDCSEKHIRRLSDAGRMPRPFRLGRSLRWDLTEIDQWIENRCPDLRKVGVAR